MLHHSFQFYFPHLTYNSYVDENGKYDHAIQLLSTPHTDMAQVNQNADSDLYYECIWDLSEIVHTKRLILKRRYSRL